MAIPPCETFSTLIKVLCPLKHLRFLPLLIRLLGLFTQACELGILITLVNTFCFNYPPIISCNVYVVFYFFILSNMFDLFEATCSFVLLTTKLFTGQNRIVQLLLLPKKDKMSANKHLI